MHEIFVFTFTEGFWEKNFIIVQENESIAKEYFEEAYPDIDYDEVVVASYALDESFTLCGDNSYPG